MPNTKKLLALAATLLFSFPVLASNGGGGTTPLGPPTTSTLGGIFAKASATTHQVVQYIDTTGHQILVQLGAADISGLAASATTDTTNASNISSGTLAAARVATLNQNTTGNAANITATSNGTLATLSVLSLPYGQLSGTVPTWNQNTTGNAATVTTNANLTGAITSVGNTTSLGSFSSAQLAAALTNETGSGSSVFATSPTLVTPVLGAASGSSVTWSGVDSAQNFVATGTGADTLPVGTTGSRPGSPVEGMIRDNTTVVSGVTGGIEGYMGGAWETLITTATGYFYGEYNASACRFTFSPSWCSGSDIGAWINAAEVPIGTGPGKVIVDSNVGVYAWTTPIVKPHNVHLDCQMAQLNWTATTGAALKMYESSSTDYQTAGNPNIGAVENCNIYHSAGYTSGNTNIGVYLGGDPAGVISPITSYAPFPTLINTQISGFQYGLELGNNSWNLNFEHGLIYNNYDGIFGPGGVVNDGEVMSVTDSTIYDQVDCGMQSTVQDSLWDFKGDKFDYNPNGALCGTVGRFNVSDFTMEQVHGPMVNFTSNIQLAMYGGQMAVEGSSSAGEHGYIYDESNDPNFNTVSLTDVQLAGNYAVPQIVYTGALANVHLHTAGIRWTATGTLSGSNPPVSDATNTIFTQDTTNFSSFVTVGTGRTADATPSNSINLYHTTTTAYAAASADAFAPLYIYNNSTATGAATGITFRQDGSGSTAKASIIVTNAASGSALMQFNARTSSVENNLMGIGLGGITIGSTYVGNTPPANGLSVQGSVSIGTSSSTQNLTVNGSFGTHRQPVADANYTVLAADRIISYTSLTAARVISVACTFGSATNPSEFVVVDESGSVTSLNTITLTPSSGTIDGQSSKVIMNTTDTVARTPYHFYANGTNCFTD